MIISFEYRSLHSVPHAAQVDQAAIIPPIGRYPERATRQDEIIQDRTPPPAYSDQRNTVIEWGGRLVWLLLVKPVMKRCRSHGNIALAWFEMWVEILCQFSTEVGVSKPSSTGIGRRVDPR
jgi:hypothetical protein